MACAIEDAGFEMRDMMQWLYGCISEDTEILTINGWERYHKNIDASSALCYNIETNKFVFEKPLEVYCYENKHPAYRIKSDFTDQIVSRNHRCIVEREGRNVFKQAETLELEEVIPFLESLSDLPETIPCLYEGTGVKKQDLLEKMCWRDDKKKKDYGAQEREHSNTMCRMREDCLEVEMPHQKSEKPHMLKPMQRDNSRSGMGKTRMQGPCRVDGQKPSILQGKDERGEQSCVEGGRNVFQEEGQLCGREICSCAPMGKADGPQRRIHYGTSVVDGRKTGAIVVSDRGCASHRPQSSKQRHRESNAFPKQFNTSSVGRTTAAVEKVEYTGKMWCIETQSGAFVARRNGQIFITGNSGFPKGQNISKGIDKAAGAEREVTGVAGKSGSIRSCMAGDFKGGEYMMSAPATDNAKKWDGWNTALKPANEPICLARKPLSEKTIVANVLKWGTGGLNIDGCKIGTKDNLNGGAYSGETGHRNASAYEIGQSAGEYIPPLGRYPANVILDKAAGEILDQQSGNLKAGKYSKQKRKRKGFMLSGSENNCQIANAPDNYGDSGGASRFFYCAKASKSERGKGNNHTTVKPVALMQYLVRLITPHGGIVLDPFAGSGTTGIAAANERFGFIGVEQDAEYCAIARQRIELCKKPRTGELFK